MISIITPLSASGNRYIRETYQSLLDQVDAPEWEWVTLMNNGGRLPDDIRPDPRVKQYVTGDSGRIGNLKATCCEQAEGDIIVELDHDDILTAGALRKIRDAFDSPERPDFVYSDFAEFVEKDGRRVANVPYRSDCGWGTYHVAVGWGDGSSSMLCAMRAPPVTPHNLRRIEWAPNHVRAWRRDTYEKIGRHDRKLAVCDDHDLMLRFWEAGAKFHHIPECLYLYRVHAEQATTVRNGEIQAKTQELYDGWIERLALGWAKQQGLAALDMCSGPTPREGFVGVDAGHERYASRDETEVEVGDVVRWDLEHRWPGADNSVGVLRFQDGLEHLRDPVHVMNEAYRVLAPGGFLLTSTPSTDGRGAFCDPTHVSFWNELSFRYFSSPAFARFIPAFKGRFAVTRLRTHFPTPWHEENRVPYVEAHLVCLKPGYEHYGENKWR